MGIEAVLFDMGGTLEDIYYDQENRFNACQELLDYLRSNSINITDPVEVFWEKIYSGYKDYYKMAESTMRESAPSEIWGKWNLRDYRISEQLIDEIGEELAVMWETKFFQRGLKKEAPQLLEDLKNRGYKLGVISNTSSRTQVYDILEMYKIRHYFQTVALSSICGYRKPHSVIFQEGLKLMGAVPERSAFVGDTVSRDIIGAKAANFKLSIQIKSFLTPEKDKNAAAVAPDVIVPDLSKVVEVLSKYEG